MGTHLQDAALPRGARRTVRVGLWLLGVLIAAAALVGAPWPHGSINDTWADILQESVNALAAILVITRAVLVRRARAAWTLIAIAITASLAADIYFLTVVQLLDPEPYPSLSDAGWLAFYPLTYAALALVLRSRVDHWHTSTWLDGLVAGCGLGALAGALVLGRLIPAGTTRLAELATAAAYPVGDLLMLTLLVGSLAVVGWRVGPALWLLIAGMVSLVVGDMIFLTSSAANAGFASGGLLDLAWPIGFSLLAAAAWAREPERAVRRMNTRSMLAIPLLFAASSLVVLMRVALDPRRPDRWVVGLSGASILLALIRTALTFREVRRLTEASQQARTDELTGLPNRRAFLERLDETTPRYALLLLDLDRFKEVNDSFGHPVGDQLLRLIGPRIDESLNGVAMLARMGGDEFGLLLLGADRTAASRAALEIKVALREAFVLDGMSLHMDASIGIALAPEHGTSPTALLRAADLAMYDAKCADLGYTVYTPGEASSARQRLQTLEELRDALTSDQLVVHFQPKLDLATNRVVGAEALIRWEHPTRGLVYPDAFLPLAEQAGLMRQVAAIVLEQSLGAVRDWRAAGHDMHVAVNLSASDLRDSALPAQILTLVTRFGLPTDALVLEITESMLMADAVRSRDVLVGLQKLGVRIAVDDFGTGYSSLAYLRELPVHELKLDRSFVSHLHTDPRAAAIVRSTVQLSHELGMIMVAEGVEDAHVLSSLVTWRCDVAQGYHIARPMSAELFGPWLRAYAEQSAAVAAP